MADKDEKKTGDGKKKRGLMRRLKELFASELEKMATTDKEIEQFQKELEEKNRRGTRRTDGRI